MINKKEMKFLKQYGFEDDADDQNFLNLAQSSYSEKEDIYDNNPYNSKEDAVKQLLHDNRTFRHEITRAILRFDNESWEIQIGDFGEPTVYCYKDDDVIKTITEHSLFKKIIRENKTKKLL